MRQLPSLELHNRRTGLKRNASTIGASAAVVGASALFAGKAGSQQMALQPPVQLPVAPAEAGPAAEPVLIATFAGEPAALATPASTTLPEPMIDPASGAVIDGSALAMASTDAPSFTPLPQLGLPAVAMVANVQDLAQAAPGDQAAAGNGTYWPEGHWADSGSTSSSWLDGVVSFAVSSAAVGLIGAGGWLLWRYINTEPTFDDALVFVTFEESPAGAAVYTAPGKDADGDDLTYSIVAYDTDDSSLLTIDAETGEVTFINDPLVSSPGDLDRDGVYKFVIQVEDEDGNTATQTVEMTISAGTPSDFDQTDFIQNGGSVFGDEFEISTSSASASLFDIAGGSGNDLAEVTGTFANFGVDLGAGEDTLWVVTGGGASNFLVDLGEEGRDTIELDADVLSLVVQNFDADDLIYLDGGVNTPSVGLGVDYDRELDGTVGTPYFSEALALAKLGGDEVVAYSNGQHSFLLISDGTAGTPATTIKLEDYILTDYSQIEVA